jgi:alkylated DNA repair dioxygenase AlkB
MVNSLTNCGTWGWFSDRRGYRYERLHPDTGKPRPVIPETLLELAVGAAARAGQRSTAAANLEVDAAFAGVELHVLHHPRQLLHVHTN